MLKGILNEISAIFFSLNGCKEFTEEYARKEAKEEEERAFVAAAATKENITTDQYKNAVTHSKNMTWSDFGNQGDFGYQFDGVNIKTLFIRIGEVYKIRLMIGDNGFKIVKSGAEDFDGRYFEISDADTPSYQSNLSGVDIIGQGEAVMTKLIYNNNDGTGYKYEVDAHNQLETNASKSILTLDATELLLPDKHYYIVGRWISDPPDAESFNLSGKYSSIIKLKFLTSEMTDDTLENVRERGKLIDKSNCGWYPNFQHLAAAKQHAQQQQITGEELEVMVVRRDRRASEVPLDAIKAAQDVSDYATLMEEEKTKMEEVLQRIYYIDRGIDAKPYILTLEPPSIVDLLDNNLEWPQSSEWYNAFNTLKLIQVMSDRGEEWVAYANSLIYSWLWDKWVDDVESAADAAETAESGARGEKTKVDLLMGKDDSEENRTNAIEASRAANVFAQQATDAFAAAVVAKNKFVGSSPETSDIAIPSSVQDFFARATNARELSTQIATDVQSMVDGIVWLRWNLNQWDRWDDGRESWGTSTNVNEWTLTINGVITPSVGDTVEQGGVTGTLKTVTNTGVTTSVVIITNTDTTFVASTTDVVIGTTTVLAADVTAAVNQVVQTAFSRKNKAQLTAAYNNRVETPIDNINVRIDSYMVSAMTLEEAGGINAMTENSTPHIYAVINGTIQGVEGNGITYNDGTFTLTGGTSNNTFIMTADDATGANLPFTFQYKRPNGVFAGVDEQYELLLEGGVNDLDKIIISGRHPASSTLESILSIIFTDKWGNSERGSVRISPQ